MRHVRRKGGLECAQNDVASQAPAVRAVAARPSAAQVRGVEQARRAQLRMFVDEAQAFTAFSRRLRGVRQPQGPDNELLFAW